MRRALLIALLASFAGVPATAGAAPLAKARLTECLTALDPGERKATFSGDVRAIRGAAQLQVKFVLHARTEDEQGWTRVAAPGFGDWNTSEPGIGRYVYAKTVENLLAPARYRTVVHFRWLSAAGRPLLRMRRATRVCRQPDLRPDLVPERLTRSADGYEVTIANDGRNAAESFVVTIEVAGALHQLAYVERLEGRSRTRVAGSAPPCEPGQMVTVRVDADNAVDEAEEEANAMAVACPAAKGH